MKTYTDFNISHLPSESFIQMYELLYPLHKEEWWEQFTDPYWDIYTDEVIGKECTFHFDQMEIDHDSEDPEQLSLDYEKSLHLNAAGFKYLPYICQTK